MCIPEHYRSVLTFVTLNPHAETWNRNRYASHCRETILILFFRSLPLFCTAFRSPLFFRSRCSTLHHTAPRFMICCYKQYHLHMPFIMYFTTCLYTQIHFDKIRTSVEYLKRYNIRVEASATLVRISAPVIFINTSARNNPKVNAWRWRFSRKTVFH